MILRKLAIIGALSAILLAPGAQAELSQKYQKCMDTSNGITVDMVNCIYAESERQDALLNMYYKKLMKGLDPEQAQTLKLAQRAWLKWREANIDFAASGEGTMAVLNTAALDLSMLESRVNDLEQYCVQYLPEY